MPEGLETSVAALAELDEVVDEDAGVTQGLLEATVGRRREFFGGRRNSGRRVGLGMVRQGEVAECVVLQARARGQAGRGVIHLLRLRFETVRVHAEAVLTDEAVREVVGGFRHSAEGRWRLHPSHRGGHGDANELWFALVLGEHKCEA